MEFLARQCIICLILGDMRCVQRTLEKTAEGEIKESFIKAVREGLKLDLRTFEIRVDEGSPVLIRQPEEYPEKYYYKEYTLEAGDAKCAVCSTEPDILELTICEL